MNVYDLPPIIQGGMGVAISNYKLANAVAQAGQLGVISGAGIAVVMSARLQDGDPGGDVQRALGAFPDQTVAKHIINTFYLPEGRRKDHGYRRLEMWTMKPSAFLQQLTVAAAFVEVWLAKEGHNNPIGLNQLEKLQMPTPAILYGAMLAGIDVVIMGAGIPMQVPGLLDKLAQHQSFAYRIDLESDEFVPNDDTEADLRLSFDPQTLFPEIQASLGSLTRPIFMPIISSIVLAKALLSRANGSIEGFVVETPIAGGHNAPPRGAMQLNERGEPIYGNKDVVDLPKLVALGKPFWLAGGYGKPEALQAAFDAGAQGVQVGSLFAYCDESGMAGEYKYPILQKLIKGEAEVTTSPRVSPTGFPFKVVNLEGTASDINIVNNRERLCDMGFLRKAYRTADGKIGFRCPSEPVNTYLKKGGKLEDTEGRTCLCNELGAAAGFSNVRRDGYAEPALITSGDDFVNIPKMLADGQDHYSAQDVINYLLQVEPA